MYIVIFILVRTKYDYSQSSLTSLENKMDRIGQEIFGMENIILVKRDEFNQNSEIILTLLPGGDYKTTILLQ